MNALPYLWLLPALPLLGSAIMLLFGRTFEGRSKTPARWPGILCSLLMAASFLVALDGAIELSKLPGARFEARGGRWFAGGEWGFLFDQVSAELTLLVTGIGTLVHLYSLAYMGHDKDQYRYFGGLNFFVAMMQVLVLANNYLLLFAGWEGVGLASYLLIGFHYEQWHAGIAAMKAFVINRAADASLFLGIIFIILKTGTARFGAVERASAGWNSAEIVLATLLLLIGAMGKSAQFPLHIWLPDAMAGPTPVSALIHSATMVCAGVYLIARSSFLFVHSPGVNLGIAVIGTITAFLAATIALVENDIKRVLAYSTVSQIGFMFIALGAGAYTAALFHLFTHAFFKSLLFLGSGSLIHALKGEQNLKHMGGLRRQMPITFVTMAAAALALSAVPGFAGFFSKDAILGETLHIPNGWLFLSAGLITSLLTAGYAWRMMLLAFSGQNRSAVEHVHESPLLMTGPMCLLAVGCVLAGWIPALIHKADWLLMTFSSLVAFAGIVLARHYYLVAPENRAAWDVRFKYPIQLLRNRWYIDALYEERILNGIVLRMAEGAAETDARLIDAGVQSVSWSADFSSRILRWIDTWIVDGLVRLSSAVVRAFSTPARAIQTGFVQTYALLFIAGLLLALGYYFSR